jgi:hypothetical protein
MKPQSQVQDQLNEASLARDIKSRIRLEAERMLREAMGIKKNALNGVGEPPRPFEMVARETLIKPDLAATSWRLFATDLAKLHCFRFHPVWAAFVAYDPGLCCDMLVEPNARNTHTLAGWEFAPEQLLYMCNANGADIFPPAMPKMSVDEWEGVSDSWLMKAQGSHAKTMDILAQVKEKIENAEMNAIVGGTSEIMTAAVAAMVSRLGMQ